MGVQLSQIRATRAAEAKDAELQKDVETKKAETELERLRAKDLVRSKIAKETAQQEADASYYRETKNADGRNYLEKQKADAAYYNEVKTTDGRIYSQKQDAEIKLFTQTKTAEADYFQQIKEADASFYAKKKDAEGIQAQAQAYKSLAEAFGGPQGLLQFMMLKEGVHEKLALANAKAIQGLQPKITVWNTGAQEGGGGGGGAADAMAPIKNIMQALPPLLSTIHEQTGIKPPGWMVSMPEVEEQRGRNGAPTKDELNRLKMMDGDKY